MKTRFKILISVFAVVSLITVGAGAFWGYFYYNERQRIRDADLAFRPILQTRCEILSQPCGLRYCRYLVEFSPESSLSDANIDVLRSLNLLPTRNTLDVVIKTPKITDEALPTLKTIRTFDLLDVTETRISNEGIEELSKDLSDCHVNRRRVN